VVNGCVKAFFANEMCTDLFRHVAQFGGVPGAFFLALWIGANFTTEQQDLRVSPGETLRLDIGSRSELLRQSVGDGHVHFDLPVPPYLSRNTVHFGGESWIEVTEVPVAERP
jgi:hypothetical protein